MDINQLTTQIGVALAHSDDLLTWALDTYQRSHQVFIAADERDLPGEQSCPFVVLNSVGTAAGQSRQYKTHTVGFRCYVHDDTAPVQLLDNLRQFSGEARVETFRKKIETVVDARFGDEFLIDVDMEIDAISDYPFCGAVMTIELKQPWTGDPLD